MMGLNYYLKFQTSRTYLKFQTSNLPPLGYPRHSVTDLYALLVLVPQLPHRCACTLFLTTREIIPHLNYFISFQGGQMAVCFYCAGALYSWKESDNPFIEHAKFFPACPYIRYVKGHVFSPDDNPKHRTQID